MPQDLPDRPRTAAARPREFRLTGVHVSAIFAAFFAVVASVNFYMMNMAITTMPGLDARNGYDASQRYNALIRRAEAQEQRHWTAAASVTAAAGRTRVSVSFGAEAGEPLAVTARLEHPATRALDQALTLTPGEGGYGATVERELRGAWTLVIEARRPADGEVLFRSRNRLTIGS